MKYYIQNRYQDGAWEQCPVGGVPHYDTLDEALKVAEKCASNSIAYGMVRVVGSDHKVYHTWAAGSGSAMHQPTEIAPSYSVACEDTPGSGQFSTVASLTPTNGDTKSTIDFACHMADAVSREYPRHKIKVVDHLGNTLQTYLYTGEEEEAGAKAENVAMGTFSNDAEDNEENDDEEPFIDLRPRYSRINLYRDKGQIFISTSTLDALFVEMQLNNMRDEEGCEENDFLLNTLRDWVAKVERLFGTGPYA